MYFKNTPITNHINSKRRGYIFIDMSIAISMHASIRYVKGPPDFHGLKLSTGNSRIVYSDVHKWWAKQNLVTFFVN